MSVRNEKYHWTEESMTLDNELREKINPILEFAITRGMEIEDVYYIASMCLDELLLQIVLIKQSKYLREKE